MKKISIALASALSVLATGAFAADPIIYHEPTPDPAPIASIGAPAPTPTASGHDWSGIYVGVNGGLAIARFKNSTRFIDVEDDEVTNERWASSRTGFLGGVQAGYNWQFDEFVAGIETDFQGGSVKKTKYFDDEGDILKLKNSLDWFGTTRARVGYAVTPNTMVYGTGGLAYGKVKTSFTVDGEDDPIIYSGSRNKVGYTVGAGSEIALTDEISFKTEYLFTDLGKNRMFSHTDIDTGDSLKADNRFKMHTIRAGVNFKF